MLRSVSHVNPRADSPHVPVLHREVVAWLDLEPGMTVVDGTFGAGGHARAPGRRDGRPRLLRGDRPRPRREGPLRGVRARPSRPAHAVRARQLLAGAAQPRRHRREAPTRCCSTSASRRCRSTRPTAASPTPPTRRSTCAWIRPSRAPPPTSSTSSTSARWRGSSTSYGEERYASQIARAIVRRRAQEPFSRSGDLVETVRRAIPTPAQFGAGHPGEARLPGAADRRQRRARRARGRPRARARDAPARAAAWR